MSKRIIASITLISVMALGFAACGDKTAETSAEETTASSVSETTIVSAAETSAENSDGIPQPGDTYNGHTVDHTEDQPNCDDGSHGTIWIFYTDSSDIDYIEY